MEEPTRPHFQISLRTLLEIVAAIAVALTLLYLRPPPAAPTPATSPPAIGRYQLTREPSGGNFEFMLFDTATGKSWRMTRSGDWYSQQPPHELTQQ